MLGLVLLALSVGLADSVNPSTIAPSLYLAAGPGGAGRVWRFTLGVFAASCAGGCILVAGPGAAILAVAPHPSPRTDHLLEVGLGGLALVAAILLWVVRGSVERRFVVRRPGAGVSSFGFGAVIVAVEFPTAFPYFAVIAADIGSGESVARRLVPILVFNMAFAAPLVSIAVLRHLATARAEHALQAIRAEVDRHSAAAIVAVIALVACVLLLVGAVGLM